MNVLILVLERPTVCVTGAGADVDSAWEQNKLEARKILVNRAESPASSARFVRRKHRTPDSQTRKAMKVVNHSPVLVIS